MEHVNDLLSEQPQQRKFKIRKKGTTEAEDENIVADECPEEE